AGRPARVGGGRVAVPGYLDGIQIVPRRGAQLEVAEFDRWGEPLGDGVPRTIAAYLADLLQTDRVVVFPWPLGRTIDHQVMVDVTRFDGVVGGDVRLEARWRLLGQDRKELALRWFAAREATGESGYPALVAAMNRSLGGLGREIADSLKPLRPQPARLDPAAVDCAAPRPWSVSSSLSPSPPPPSPPPSGTSSRTGMAYWWSAGSSQVHGSARSG